MGIEPPANIPSQLCRVVILDQTLHVFRMQRGWAADPLSSFPGPKCVLQGSHHVRSLLTQVRALPLSHWRQESTYCVFYPTDHPPTHMTNMLMGSFLLVPAEFQVRTQSRSHFLGACTSQDCLDLWDESLRCEHTVLGPW
jgi:hypothetical protein